MLTDYRPTVATPRHPSRKARLLAAAAAAVLAMSVVMTASAASATLKAPASANLGSSITVTGSGFAAGQKGNLTFNGGLVTTFTASSAGSMSVPMAIPSWAVIGTGRISAKTTGGTVLATTTLTICAAGSTGTPKPTATRTGAKATPTAKPTSPPATNVPNFSHVYVIIFENKEYSSIVGSKSAPYINSLISKYGISTSFYAERHPSEPNYIALTSGGTQGVTDDGTYNLGVNNLFDQVQASGRTWKAVMQGKPAGCFTGSSSSAVVDGVGKSGAYVRKHDPAISYKSISGSAAKCANITNLASFNPASANFQFITPNMINDMHDGTIADGDNFLKAFLPKITTSSSFANSVVFITFDEGTTNVDGGGHIATIAVTPKMTAGYKATATYTHYSMLRTIEQAWGLPFLGSASSATPMAFPY
jgi:phosphatidylinositol-3-phosphatase